MISSRLIARKVPFSSRGIRKRAASSSSSGFSAPSLSTLLSAQRQETDDESQQHASRYNLHQFQIYHPSISRHLGVRSFSTNSTASVLDQGRNTIQSPSRPDSRQHQKLSSLLGNAYQRSPVVVANFHVNASQLHERRQLHALARTTVSELEVERYRRRPSVADMRRVVRQVLLSTDAKTKSPATSSKKESDSTASSFTTTQNPSIIDEPKKSSMSKQVQEAITSVSKAIVNFLIKLPGWTFFYLTHPTELRKALSDMWEAIKHEAHHYWMGTKLLYADVQTARKLLNRTLQGSPLTRRERKQLLRTVSDLFRLVPFSMFILIPFMEFALPFALRLFPNMLPSTFQDSLKAEENMKRELQSRIAMAQFFQETLQEMAKEQKKSAKNRRENAIDSSGEVQIEKEKEKSAAEMLDFLGKARNGELLPADAIIQFASHFHDDLTLDNMPRMQLINMCRYMNIPPYGADSFLRFQLRHRIRTLVEDDQRILWEGIDSLTKMELREACQERGMRSTGLSKDAYKRALQQWLDLSVNKHVPISLLVMSRSFFLREEMTTRGASDDDGSKAVAGLADAISGLDQDIVNEVVLEVATSEEKKSDPEIRKIKLEVLEAQNERILEEQIEREAATKKKEKLEKAEQKQEDSADIAGELTPTAEPALAPEVQAESPGVSQEELASEGKKEEEEEEYLSTQEMDAISQLINPDPVTKEREELEKIKAAMSGDDPSEEQGGVETAEDAPELGEEHFTIESMTTTDSVSKSEVVRSAPETFATKDEQLSSGPDTLSTTAVPEELLEETDLHDEGLDKTIEDLKARVSRMVDKIESQIDSVEEKIGDRLHFLDKDGDGILSLEEMADALQRVLKRDLSREEAMAIAALMVSKEEYIQPSHHNHLICLKDENKDGVFTVDEFTQWVETSKIVQLLKEGADGDLDRLLGQSAAESNKEESGKTGTNGEEK